jgi:hypothetical protein
MEKLMGRFSKSSGRDDDTSLLKNAVLTPQQAVSATASRRDSSDVADEEELFGLFQLWPLKDDAFEVQNTKVEYGFGLMIPQRVMYCPNTVILV